MKIKAFFQDSLIYTIAHVLTKGVGLLMIPIYTRYMTSAEYGLFDSIVVFGQLVSLVAGLQIHQAVARFFPEAENELEKSKIVSTAFWSLIILSILLSIVLLVFSMPLVQYLGGNKTELFQFRIASVSFAFMMIYTFMQAQLIWQFKSYVNTLISFSYAFFVGLLSYYFLVYLKLSISSIFIAQIIGAIIGIALSFKNSQEYYHFMFCKKVLKELLNFSFPLIFSSITLTLMINIDRIVIVDVLTISELGLYGVAYRFAAIVSFGVVGFQTALTPLVYRYYKDENTAKSIAKLTHYFIGISIIILVSMYFLSPYLIHYLTSEMYWSVDVLIPWIACSLLMGGAINFAPGIFIAKKTKFVFYINLFCLFSNTALNYFFIHSFGLLGVAYATVVCSFIYLYLYYFIGQRYYYIPYFWCKQK